MDAKRGLVREVDDGSVYALDTDPDARNLIGLRVTVEGIRRGFDRIDVERIGRT